MTQNNIFMEDENPIIYVDVLPDIHDTVTNAATSASASALAAEASASSASVLVESIRGIKTGVEVFVSQALDSMRDLYTNILTTISSSGEKILQKLQQTGDFVITNVRTLGNEYVNDAKNYAQAAQEIVDFHVSTEHLNQSKGLLAGNVSTDSVMLQNIHDNIHSTFDKSKFTVVGSPNITNDGIASGFSSSNYINTPLSISGKTITISGKAIYKTSTTEQIPFNINGSNGIYNFRFGINTSKTLNCRCVINGVDTSLGALTNLPINNDDVFEWEWIIGQSIQVFNYKINNINYSHTFSVDLSSYNLTGTTIKIGNYGSYNLAWAGSIDLKYFSITVDGVPVFSGNHTGIDTIKPDDYTVVGTPTISADGIASGLDWQNYISTTSIDFSKKVVIKGVFKFNNKTFSGGKYLLEIGNIGGLNFNSNFMSTSLSGAYSNTVSSSVYVINEPIEVEWVIDGISSVCTLKQQNNTIATLTSTLSTALSSSYTVTIGGDSDASDKDKMLADLNAFKIYVNGNLVCQPCLKIPYTKRKTRSKVVDITYRNRVFDMYEQFGYAPYYTVSETDFTLPMGEVYGMIEQLREQVEILSTQIS